MADDFGGLYPFQTVPGLLTPEMNDNVRTRSMLGAAGGLLSAGQWSKTPVNIWEALSRGVQGGLSEYSGGMNDAMRQQLVREQIMKLMQENKLNEQWQHLFAPAVPGGSGAPSGPPGGEAAPMSTGPQGAPPGLLTPQPPTLPGVPSAPIMVPQQSSPTTVRQTRATGDIGDVIDNLPPATRALVGLQGRAKGMETLAQYIGTKDKPSDTAMHFMDNETRKVLSVRANDPRADAMMNDPRYTMVSTPSMSEKTPDLVTLRSKDTDETQSFRKSDPQIDNLIKSGAWEHVTTPSSNPAERYVTVKSPDGTLHTLPANDKRVKTLTDDHGFIVTAQPPANEQPKAYLLPNNKSVLSSNGQNYRGEDGKTYKLPTSAIPLGAETAYDTVQQARSSANAAAANEKLPPEQPRVSLEDVAKAATGPYSAWQAGVNATAGGLGWDKLIGQEGLFRDTEANRNYLRLVHQTGKSALVNNPRFTQKEMDTVDGLFPNPSAWIANPRTEADKVPLLRDRLNMQMRINNEELQRPALERTRRDKLESNNIETKRVLELLGPGSSDANKTLHGNEGDNPYGDQKTVPVDVTKSRLWGQMKADDIGISKGRRYRKNDDGSATDLGPAR